MEKKSIGELHQDFNIEETPHGPRLLKEINKREREIALEFVKTLCEERLTANEAISILRNAENIIRDSRFIVKNLDVKKSLDELPEFEFGSKQRVQLNTPKCEEKFSVTKIKEILEMEDEKQVNEKLKDRSWRLITIFELIPHKIKFLLGRMN
jgi:hypothetical protein